MGAWDADGNEAVRQPADRVYPCCGEVIDMYRRPDRLYVEKMGRYTRRWSDLSFVMMGKKEEQT